MPRLLLLFFALCLPAAAAPDARFGFVGTGGRAFAAKFGLRYFTLEGNYPSGGGSLFSSVDPAQDPSPGTSVVREVAKLNVRNDGLGQSNAEFQARLAKYVKDLASWYALPSWFRGVKPAFAWYRPDPAALAAAESLLIVETIRREKREGIEGTVWEIGNEPNLFPALAPAEYGAIFAAYHRIIKGADPEAKVAAGSLFLPEPAPDLKARMADELDARIRAELQAAGAPLSSASVNSLIADVKNTLFARILALPSAEYLRQAFSAAGVLPDIVSLHAYPYDDRAPITDAAGERALLDSAFDGIGAMLAGLGAAAGLPLWITEFGNIAQGIGEEEAAARAVRLSRAFAARPGVERWFHYKATGNDEQFALFSAGAPPLTRLAAEAGFSPADGNFPCARLNAIGRAYYRESHGGGECADPARPPVIAVLASARASLAEGDSARLWVEASDPDGGGLKYAWVGPAGDTLGTGPSHTYHAGYGDAGRVRFRLVVRDAEGLCDSGVVELAVANTPLRPALLNPEGSPLAPGGALAWGWEARPDPDLGPEGLRAEFEAARDTSAAADRRADSLAAPWVPGLPSGIWFARVRLSDPAGRRTPWSSWRRLESVVPSALRPAVPGRGRKLGVDYDYRGRRLPFRAPKGVPLSR